MKAHTEKSPFGPMFAPVVKAARLTALVALPFWGLQALSAEPVHAAGAKKPERALSQTTKQLKRATRQVELKGGDALAAHVLAVHSQIPAETLISRGDVAAVAPAAMTARVTGLGLDDVIARMSGGSNAGQIIVASGASVQEAQIRLTASLAAMNANARSSGRGEPDTDGDDVPNSMDDDVDGDGIPNASDDDVDGDGVPNSIDDDVDGDGMDNSDDDDVDGDDTPNHDDGDVDGDGDDNGHDMDDDGDGNDDGADADDDNDGTGDADDDDGTPDQGGGNDDDGAGHDQGDDHGGHGNDDGSGHDQGDDHGGHGNDDGGGDDHGGDGLV